MLPSRGLRPAQFVPPTARQSTLVRVGTLRKVGLCLFDVVLPAAQHLHIVALSPPWGSVLLHDLPSMFIDA